MIAQSMTKFVFMLRNRTTSELCKDFPRAFTMPVWNVNQDDMVKSMLAIDAIQWRLTGEYAKFIIKIIELWMFVPCKLENGVWIILEEPKEYKNWLVKNKGYDFLGEVNILCKEYQEAKERVLFEGFTYHIGLDKNNPHFWFVRNSSCKIHDYEIGKLPLETFLNLNYLIELTQTAQKRIGL